MNEYIKREDAIKRIVELTNWRSPAIEAVIKTVPDADVVERKRGKWIERPRDDYQTFDECVCSKCGVVEYFNIGWKRFNFCPNCGAAMREESR